LLRFDELRDLIRVVKNSQKIKDVAKVQSGKNDFGVCGYVKYKLRVLFAGLLAIIYFKAG